MSFFPHWVLKSRKKWNIVHHSKQSTFRRPHKALFIKAFSNAFGHLPITVRISSKQHWVKIITIKNKYWLPRAGNVTKLPSMLPRIPQFISCRLWDKTELPSWHRLAELIKAGSTFNLYWRSMINLLANRGLQGCLHK